MVTASSPSTEERGMHAGVRFHQNFWRLPSSCSAVLTTIHGPLHLQRSQHYRLLSPMAALQLLPAWWPTTPTSCLIAPSLHCPRNELSRTIQQQTHNLALACFSYGTPGNVHWSVTVILCLMRSAVI